MSDQVVSIDLNQRELQVLMAELDPRIKEMAEDDPYGVGMTDPDRELDIQGATRSARQVLQATGRESGKPLLRRTSRDGRSWDGTATREPALLRERDGDGSVEPSPPSFY